MPTPTSLVPNRPLPEVAAEFLLEDSSAPDLEDLVVIVQTRQAARALKTYLAELARERSLELAPPLIVPPHFLLSLGTDLLELPPAGRIETSLAWTTVLREADLAGVPQLFPIHPPEQDYAWASTVGRALGSLQQHLGESGLTIKQAAEQLRAAGDYPEPDRWSQLAELETAFDGVLGEFGFQSQESARQAARASAVSLPSGYSRIVLIGCPDPLPAAVEILEQLQAGGTPIEVIVFAGNAAAADFDDWGRPQVDDWPCSRPLPIEEHHIHLATRPTVTASAIATHAQSLAQTSDSPLGESLTVGALEPESSFFLRQEFGNRGIPVFDPAGTTLREHGFFVLLKALANFLESGSFDHYVELLRIPDFQRYLRRRQDKAETQEENESSESADQKRPEFSPADILASFDKARNRLLPQTLQQAQNHDEAGRWKPGYWGVAALAQGLRILGDFADKPLLESLPKLLARIYSGRELSDDNPADLAIQFGGRALMQALDAFGSCPLAERATSTPGDVLSAVLHIVGTEPVFDEKEAGAVELYGWLELLWDDRPLLALAGMNEGIVPEAPTETTFLTADVRRRIGFPGGAERYARDAYILDSLIAVRAEGRGQVDLHLCKTTSDGDPLTPSRLLLACPDDQLGSRSRLVFGAPEEPARSHPWTSAFPLDPFSADLPPVTSMRVTDFRRYLDCPLQFCLQSQLGLWSDDPAKAELSRGEFGEFCHAVLAEFGADEQVRDSDDVTVIQTYLLAAADRIADQRWGADPSPAVRLQVESAKERLAAAAAVQAAHRSSGWKIRYVEQAIDEILPAWDIAGMPICGTVDRIDCHENGKQWLVLDYKTSADSKTPEQNHMVKVMASTNLDGLPDYAVTSDGGKRWADLQLPLYALGLRDFPEVDDDQSISTGYFLLPPELKSTGIKIWAKLNADLLAEALRCAEGVCQDVAAGRFWPPRSDGGDRLAPLLFKAPHKTISPPNPPIPSS